MNEEATSEEEKSEEEMRTYVMRMVERGDSWRSIRAYLDRYSSDEELIQRIIKHANHAEKLGVIESPKEKKGPDSMDLIMGTILIAGGIILTVELWHKGWIAMGTILMIFAGLMAISGNLKGFIGK